MSQKLSIVALGLSGLALIACVAVLARGDGPPPPADRPDPRIAKLEARVAALEADEGLAPNLESLEARIKRLEESPATSPESTLPLPIGGDVHVVTPATFRGTKEEKAKLESLDLDASTVMVALDLFRALERDWEKLDRIEDPERLEEARAYLTKDAITKFRHVFKEQYDAFLGSFPEWRDRVQ